MPKADFKVHHTIICDDVRREGNGKEILIGVYNDVMVFGALPAKLFQFHVRMSVTCTHTDERQYRMRLRDPKKQQLGEILFSMKHSGGEERKIVSIGWMGAEFEHEGVYEVQVGLAGGRLSKKHEFLVRTPRTEREEAQLKI